MLTGIVPAGMTELGGFQALRHKLAAANCSQGEVLSFHTPRKVHRGRGPCLMLFR